jgi:hypothetical protein
MNTTAANNAVHSTETFGLRHDQDNLIQKLRNMPPELLATITNTAASK